MAESTSQSSTLSTIRYFSTQIVLVLAIVTQLISSWLRIMISLRDTLTIDPTSTYFQWYQLFGPLSLLITLIGLMLTYYGMAKVDKITSYMTDLRQLGGFGYKILGSMTLLISIPLLMAVLNIEFLRDFFQRSWILQITAVLIVIYLIRSTYLMRAIEPKINREISIQRGIQTVSIGLLIYILSGIFINFIASSSNTAPAILELITVLTIIFGLIYTNYTIRDYQLNSVSTSEDEIELYIDAN